MTRLTWFEERPYYTGVDRGVIFQPGGIAWSGLTSVDEPAEDTIDKTRYFDGNRHVLPQGTEDFNLKIDAFTYPDEFDENSLFGFSYRTQTDSGYLIHLVYNARAVSQSKGWQTLNAAPSTSLFSWDVNTVPEHIPGIKPTAHLMIDSNLVDPEALAAFEDLIYGTEEDDSTFPTPEEVLALFEATASFVIIDHGDGTWTAIGPDDMVDYLNGTTFEISSPSAIYISSDSYTLSSY